VYQTRAASRTRLFCGVLLAALLFFRVFDSAAQDPNGDSPYLVADQPALHGPLAKVRDLGLPLLSVVRVEEDAR
jgi:hypothetical protein